MKIFKNYTPPTVEIVVLRTETSLCQGSFDDFGVSTENAEKEDYDWEY